MIDRPTSDAKAVVLDHCDTVWDQLSHRLVGLDDDEYLWAPASDVWTVRRTEGGAVVVDGFGERDLDPGTGDHHRLANVAHRRRLSRQLRRAISG